MRQDGSSCLLLPAPLLPPILSCYGLPPLRSHQRLKLSTEFAALSPITFTSTESLRCKLASYHSTRKKRGKSNDELRDLSAANKMWALGAGGGTAHGEMRCAFEHARSALNPLATLQLETNERITFHIEQCIACYPTLSILRNTLVRGVYHLPPAVLE